MKIDFSTLEHWINDAFLPLWTDKNRFIICKGGAGSGKSVDAHRRALFRFIAEPGHNYIIVRKVERTLSISCIPLMRRFINEWNLQAFVRENRSTRTMTSLTNGNQIKFIGLDDIEKIKSITFENGILTDILVEEATEITETEFNQLNLRLRGKARVPFQITLLFNPISDTHWIKKRFFDNKTEKEKTTIHESTYLDNKFIDPVYKDELEALKLQDRVYYEVYAQGKWGSVGNLVFRNIIIQECPYQPYEFDQIIAGQDFGFNHYNAIELIGLKDGDKYSFNELACQHMTNDQIITENEKEEVLKKDQRCICDSAEPKSIKEWRQAGYQVEGAKKGKDSVKEQISVLNRGTWYIDPLKCPRLVSEVNSYKWRVNRDGELLDEPVSYKDDAIAACRYAVEELGDQTRLFTDEEKFFFFGRI